MIINAGVGEDLTIDSVVVTWTDSKKLAFMNVATNQQLIADYKKAVDHSTEIAPQIAISNWFTNVTTESGINFQHQQRDFIDFSIQKLLPHKFSEYSPAIAVADINMDGLDDFIVGGSPGKSLVLFFQQQSGKFSEKKLFPDTGLILKNSDERGLLLFDADGDLDPDLYIASGGYSYAAGDSAYCDQFLVNDGKGNFKKEPVRYLLILKANNAFVPAIMIRTEISIFLHLVG